MIYVSGSCQRDLEVPLPDIAVNGKLPFVVMVHTQNVGGVPKLSGAYLSTAPTTLNERYEVSGETYDFVCYTSNGNFQIDMGYQNNTVGYRDIIVKRLSVYLEK